MGIDAYTDRQIVEAILRRDTLVTKAYLYGKCRPLFAAIQSRYHTDCESVTEFTHEIYIYILTPRKPSGRSKLEEFGFRCSLTMWLKIVAENYCHQLFAKRRDLPEEYITPADRFAYESRSLQSEMNTLNMHDLQKILSMMPCERYRRLIQLRYVDENSNEETALALATTMANYYNMHRRAKAQFCNTLRKEGLI